jgi:hypothetical protein
MNKPIGSDAFAQAQKIFSDALVPGNVQSAAQQGVAASHALFTKAATAARDNTRLATEIADTAWGSSKMLHEKMVKNLTANAEAMFAAAHAMAKAKSLPEVARLQGELLQKIASQSAEQTKEFADLSARAAQHLLEKVQAAAARSLTLAP